MDDFLDDLIRRIEIAKRGIVIDSTKSDFKRSPMKSQRTIIVRQLMAKSQEDATLFDLSTEDGIKNTEEVFIKQKRLNEWLTLPDKHTL